MSTDNRSTDDSDRDPGELSDDELLERIAATDTPLGERCRRILGQEEDSS